MGSFKIFRRQTVRLVATVGLLAATIVPGFIPTSAFAATVSDRSIALSSSSKGTSSVSYDIKFTAVAAAGAFAVTFCQENPVMGDTCTAPAGMVTTGATSATSGFTDVTTPQANRIIVGDPVTIGQNVEVAVDGITNPTTAGQFYARIITYDTTTNATNDVAAAGTTGAVDNGGVALSITDSVAVSGRVLETMVFCISGPTSDVLDTNPIGLGCDNPGGNTMTAPTLQLGDKIGDNYVLSSSKISTGDIFAQLSTNAVSGAVVNLKSTNDCGGLMRLGAASCDIVPAQKTDIAFGQAKVGVMVAADAGTDTTMGSTGTLEAVSGSGYNDSTYALNYAAGGATGVTSPYGDPILDTGAVGSETQPVNRNMKLTFGASVAGNTPAGNYSNSYSLVATGKF